MRRRSRSRMRGSVNTLRCTRNSPAFRLSSTKFSRLSCFMVFSSAGATAEFRRDLLARLPHMALELLEVVGEAGTGPSDAHGGDTVAMRIEEGRRHRHEVGLALATVDGDAEATDLLKLAPEVGRPHDRRRGQAPHPSLDDLRD